MVRKVIKGKVGLKSSAKKNLNNIKKCKLFHLNVKCR